METKDLAYNLDDYAYCGGTEPAVFVTTSYKHKNGIDAGKLLDLTRFEDYDEFMSVCAYLHGDEDEPDFMFIEWENVPSVWETDSDLDEFLFDKIREWNDELSIDERDAFETFMGVYGDDDIQSFKESFEGEYYDMEEFAEHLVDECGLLHINYNGYVPSEVREQFEIIAEHFDFKSFGDSLEQDYTIEDGYVFRNL